MRHLHGVILCCTLGFDGCMGVCLGFLDIMNEADSGNQYCFFVNGIDWSRKGKIP
jgi:hypothetical protein